MCELCDIGPLDPPCAIICEEDCSTCWVDAAPMRNKVVLDMSSDAFKTGSRPQLTGSKRVRFCCEDMTSQQLVAFLNKAYPDARVRSSGADDRKISKEVAGTLADILKEVGLEASGY